MAWWSFPGIRVPSDQPCRLHGGCDHNACLSECSADVSVAMMASSRIDDRCAARKRQFLSHNNLRYGPRWSSSQQSRPFLECRSVYLSVVCLADRLVLPNRSWSILSKIIRRASVGIICERGLFGPSVGELSGFAEALRRSPGSLCSRTRAL
jgi:hypothetical protein